MRLSTLYGFGIVWVIAIGLVACDEEKEAGGSAPGGSPFAGVATEKMKGAKELLNDEQFAEKRLPSARRLGEVLVAEAGGMKRFQEPEIKRNEARKQVTADAQYHTGDEFRWDNALKVEIQWYGKKFMGISKLDFGMYKAKKLTIEGFEARAKYPNPSENDKGSNVRMLIAPQLIVNVESEHFDVDVIVKLLSALDFSSLKKQQGDGSLFRVRARITTGFEGCCIPPSRVARLLKPVRLRPPRSLLDGRISALRPA